MRFGTAITAIAAFAASSVNADSIYDIAKSNDAFTTLVAAVDAAGLDGVLSSPGNYTVFAPPNTAFEKLDQAAVAKLLDPDWYYHLQDLIKYHALASPVYSKDLEDGLTAETLNGEDITINLDPPRINDASNIILELVDIQADNGVIHAVDSVLLPTSATSNIVAIAQSNPDFSTLVDLVVAADLVDALSGDGPMTVFAPTNDAFAKLPEGTIDDLKKAENKDKLTAILTYHVLGLNVASENLADGQVITLEGSAVEIKASPPMVNDANIVAADVLASNGIVHVIDSVLIPDADEPTEPTDPTSAPPTAAPAALPTAAPSSANTRILSTAALIVGGVVCLLF